MRDSFSAISAGRSSTVRTSARANRPGAGGSNRKARSSESAKVRINRSIIASTRASLEGKW